MNPSVNLLLRGLCLLVYGLALARWAEVLPVGMATYAPVIAVALLAAHVLEVAFVFKHVRLYKGPLAVSVLLTVLFGLLHWKPMADEQRARQQKQG